MNLHLQNNHHTDFDIILDSIADGVFTVDHEWKITSFNRAAEEILGIPRDEAIGRPCCEVFRSSICESQCALSETMRSGQSIVNKTIFVVNTKGEKIPISISTAILKDEEGNIIGGVETFRDVSQVEELKKELTKQYSFMDILGRSPSMQNIFEILPHISQSNVAVLLSGESGTGKELFARAIHNISPRAKYPFVAVNCAALPDSLLESELFGYKAGAFTDAKHNKAGRFSLAHRGSIFLDEIGDISPAMQTRLLRVLQDQTFEPLGSTDSVQVDVRIITASNKDLSQLVQQGVFRDDLYYRINVIKIDIPPLRERKEDIPQLIQHFVSKYSRLESKEISGVSDSVMATLMDYEFPGNVRELENIIAHSVVLCSTGTLEIQHLPSNILPQSLTPSTPSTKPMSLRDMESFHIMNSIRQHHGNRTAAAKALGIHPSTLFRKIKELNLDLPDMDGRHRK